MHSFTVVVYWLKMKYFQSFLEDGYNERIKLRMRFKSKHFS